MDIVEYLEDNRVADDLYLYYLKNSSKNLRELHNDGESALLDRGLLDATLNKLENEFQRLLTAHSVPLPMSSRLLVSKHALRHHLHLYLSFRTCKQFLGD